MPVVRNKAFPRGSIYTSGELHRQARRLDRRLASVDQVLIAMRRGEFLHLQYQVGRPLWALSNGRTVSSEVAAILINDARIVPVGRALFDDMPGQSWKHGGIDND
jgi:hypothetical protein